MSSPFRKTSIERAVATHGCCYSPKALLATVLACVISFSCHAVVTVEYHADTGTRNVVDSAGKTLADGNELRIGYLKEGFDPAKDGGNIAAVANAWRSLHQTKIQTLFGEAGRYYDSCTYSEADFADKSICLWILKTSNNEAVLGDLSNVTEYGLFSVKNGTKFPNPDVPPPANYVLLSSSDMDTTYFGSFNNDSLVLGKIQGVSSGLSIVDWRKNAFPAQMDDSLKADSADPDGDGMPNVLEYVSGTDPTKKEQTTVSYSKQMINNLPSLTITYQQAKNRPDVSVKGITSVDLKVWQSEGITKDVIAENEQSQTIRVAVPIDKVQGWLQLLLLIK